jgi:Arc/MetJ-type ribon-helix-helix transcriptional regulator
LLCQRFAVEVVLLTVSDITEIREAIQKLPAKEAWQLAEELRDHLDGLWDEQFEKDVKEGRLDGLIARAREEHASGKTRSMDEIVGDN